MNLFKKMEATLAKHYRPAIELKNLYSLSVAAVPEQPYYLTLFPNILILKEQTVIQMVRIMKGGLSMASESWRESGTFFFQITVMILMGNSSVYT